MTGSSLWASRRPAGHIGLSGSRRREGARSVAFPWKWTNLPAPSTSSRLNRPSPCIRMLSFALAPRNKQSGSRSHPHQRARSSQGRYRALARRRPPPSRPRPSSASHAYSWQAPPKKICGSLACRAPPHQSARVGIAPVRFLKWLLLGQRCQLARSLRQRRTPSVPS